MKAKTKRDIKLIGAGLLIGFVLGVYVAWPKTPEPALSRMGQEVREMNADTDRWLDEMERELRSD